MRKIAELFIVFFKIGAFTFGGGYAILPMMQHEIVDKHNWATEEELMNYYAVAQCTPGIISVNAATFIGFKKMGALGAIIATLGVVLPSLIIVLIIATLIQQISAVEVIDYAFAGIRVAVAVLIFNAIINLWKAGVNGLIGIVIFIAVIIASLGFGIPTIYIIVSAIVIGLLMERFGKSEGGIK